eukprot:TRINITY_DN1532_c0_g2_i1.p1 TRINITY_DN1532_c0_g2~~TRINITY_DN1532_c0_g2_i1.p1  ORF type:complete len:352 (+),score=60.14 TRINITY_DN1532_c0_g2_i1:173-1228(+)
MEHIKIVVVGDGTVGKTCLLIAYTMKAFPRDYVPTVFDNYNAVVQWEGRPINLGLWDTAGQDDFEHMRPISYLSADIYLLFFAIDNPTSLQNIKHKWMPEISKHITDQPLILVGTKKDLRRDAATVRELKKKKQKPVSFKQGRKMAREIGCVAYIECSAIQNTGFRDIFSQTIAAILNKRHKKKHGSVCWATNCETTFGVLSKRNRCVRCHQKFCKNCVTLLPKSHDYANHFVCKHCKEIDDDEPLKRAGRKRLTFRRLRKQKKDGNKEEEEEDEDEEDDESDESDPDSTDSESEVKAKAQPLTKHRKSASTSALRKSVEVEKNTYEQQSGKKLRIPKKGSLRGKKSRVNN